MITALIIILTLITIVLAIVDIAALPTFIVFLILKLSGAINWEWLYVCMPLIVLAASMVLTGTTHTINIKIKGE